MYLLQSSGIIASQEASLIIQATLLMLIVVVPVFVLLFFFAYYYRAGNHKARYSPNWEHAKMDELIWWAIPLEIILVLGALTWGSTHALDPRKPLPSTVPALQVEVVALPWKWLFLYPSLGVASLNTLEIPANIPVEFHITADAPMNSFWVPQLGGQIYAMTGMDNRLNLMADKPGDYPGYSANYSGAGFAGMHFVVHAVAQKDFEAWVAATASTSPVLDQATYSALRAPSTEQERTYAYRIDLYHAILKQFGH